MIRACGEFMLYAPDKTEHFLSLSILTLILMAGFVMNTGNISANTRDRKIESRCNHFLFRFIIQNAGGIFNCEILILKMKNREI